MCGRSAGEPLAFAETSAIINYAKASAFGGVFRNVPNRAVAMQIFIDKGLSAGLKIVTSGKVLNQLAHARDVMEKELMAKGLEAKKTAKVVQVATEAIKELLGRISLDEVDGSAHLQKIKDFFERYKIDRRMLDAVGLKEGKTGKHQQAIPEKSDMEIFADALQLCGDYFITTDNHFCLEEEIKAEFGIEVINHYNYKVKIEKLFGA
ncbi:MAG: hypothetical protein AB1657_00385 [Candidatus Micrarchaeota archaeon]